MKMETKNKSKLLDMFFAYYNAKKRKMFKKENQTIHDHPIVFFGDSITDRCDVKKYYPDKTILNRGISGNTVTDLMQRMQVSVYDAHPSKIVLLIGINDLMNIKRSAQETAEKYEELLRLLISHCKDIPILCQSVYPGYDAEKNRKNKGLVFPLQHLASEIVTLNGYIKELCRKYHCTYIDVHTHLKNTDNTMISTYSDDGCHPNDAGYKKISDILKAYL